MKLLKKFKKDNEDQEISSLKIQNPIFVAINYLILVIIGIIVIAPIFIELNGSFKTDSEFLTSGIWTLPKNIFNFKNYKLVWDIGQMPLAFKNVLIYVVVSVTLSIAFASMVSYVLGRFRFKLRPVILGLFLLPMLIPSITTQVATFNVIKGLGLYNTMGAPIILYAGADITQIYLYLQFIQKIPYSLDESARLEGASYFRIFWSIILPQMKPAIATTIILKTVSIYNDMFTPYLYTPNSELKTVSTALMAFSSDKNSQWNVMGAGIIFVMIPTLLLYLFLQRYIFAGVTSGSVKG
jgi:raffinose/stachyose/melibiose transport system permease protein